MKKNHQLIASTAVILGALEMALVGIFLGFILPQVMPLYLQSLLTDMTAYIIRGYASMGLIALLGIFNLYCGIMLFSQPKKVNKQMIKYAWFGVFVSVGCIGLLLVLAMSSFMTPWLLLAA